MTNHPTGQRPSFRVISGELHAENPDGNADKQLRCLGWVDRLRVLNRRNRSAVGQSDMEFTKYIQEHEAQLFDALVQVYGITSPVGSHEESLRQTEDRDFCGLTYGDAAAFTQGFHERIGDLYKASRNHATNVADLTGKIEPLIRFDVEGRNLIVDDFYFDGLSVLAQIRALGVDMDARQIGSRIPVVFYDEDTISTSLVRAVFVQGTDPSLAVTRLLDDPIAFINALDLEAEQEDIPARSANHPVHHRRREPVEPVDRVVRGVDRVEGQPSWTLKERAFGRPDRTNEQH